MAAVFALLCLVCEKMDEGRDRRGARNGCTSHDCAMQAGTFTNTSVLTHDVQPIADRTLAPCSTVLPFCLGGIRPLVECLTRRVTRHVSHFICCRHRIGCAAALRQRLLRPPLAQLTLALGSAVTTAITIALVVPIASIVTPPVVIPPVVIPPVVIPRRRTALPAKAREGKTRNEASARVRY